MVSVRLGGRGLTSRRPRDTFHSKKGPYLFSFLHRFLCHPTIVLATDSFAKPSSNSGETMSADSRSEARLNNDTLEPLLTIDEAARIIGRTHWTLRRDIKAGKLKCVRIGRRIMIEPSEIRRLIQEGREKHGSR